MFVRLLWLLLLFMVVVGGVSLCHCVFVSLCHCTAAVLGHMKIVRRLNETLKHQKLQLQEKKLLQLKALAKKKQQQHHRHITRRAEEKRKERTRARASKRRVARADYKGKKKKRRQRRLRRHQQRWGPAEALAAMVSLTQVVG